MTRIQSPETRSWPWGEAREVRQRLVEPSDLAERPAPPPPDPRRPRLPSPAVLAFSAPPRTADALRLPDPPGAETPISDWLLLESAVARAEASSGQVFPSNVPGEGSVAAGMLRDEAAMLGVLRSLLEDVRWIRERQAEAEKERSS